MVEVAKKLGDTRALYLVTTHFHPEHDLGAQAFPENTTLIRSNDQVKDIAEFGLQLAQVFARRSAVEAELLKNADFRKANVTFDRDYALDLGGVKVQLIAMGANHTRGDTAMWVELDRVLFSGDVAMRPQPAFASPYSTIRQWLSSLDKLEALKPAVIVPSHGPTATWLSFPVTAITWSKCAIEPPPRKRRVAPRIRRLKRSPPRWRSASPTRDALPVRSRRLTPKRNKTS